jgi:NAD-dependent deacetylase
VSPERNAVTVAGLDRARALVSRARRIVTLTGAGVSAESGVPTFRGHDGLWKTHRAEDLATPHAFARDPRLVWEWYGWRRRLVAQCKPNAAHAAVARAAHDRPGFRIVTQNVDGLHSVAANEFPGTSEPPLELHGALFRTRCTRCAAVWVDHTPVDATSRETLPSCPACGSLARPDIVWFGESLDPAVIGAAVTHAEAADVMLVVGTSALVHPAAGLADITRQAGGSVIEVNVEDTPLSRTAAVTLRGPAAVLVPLLLQ